MVYLEMNHVKKSFDDLEVLKDISFQVNQGEVVSIIGPSGSGKSTLLRCATLLETMDCGDLSFIGESAATIVNGKTVYAKNAKLNEIKSVFGLVFQNFNLFPHFSVLKNVMDAPVHVQKRPKEEAKKEAMELLDKMGLADKADYYPCQLSGGQQQRVAIARALALNPKVLFFDEPTSALDPISTSKIEDLAMELKKDYTIVIVTHEMEFARNISDRIIFMDKGVIAVQGTPEEVFQSEHTRMREFLGKLKH